jgi:murein DD-endopeptidase MepM/ murein hydrolase activator NlpD
MGGHPTSPVWFPGGLTDVFPLVFLAAAAALVPSTDCYRPPVMAPIVEHFEAPVCRWCPGNRGLDYATRPGEPVRAAASGRVTFAGLVAGRRWVTIAHRDGLRTSYGPLAAVAVRAGADVTSGQALGRAAGPLHFGVRRGDVYVDPETVLGAAVRLRPRLVPLHGAAPPRPLPSCTPPSRSRTALR